MGGRLQQWLTFGGLVGLAFLPLSAAALAFHAQNPWSQDGRVLPLSQHWMDEQRGANPGLSGIMPGHGHAQDYRVAGSVGTRQAELIDGHRALRAFDMQRARTIAADLSRSVADSPDGRYFLARLAFYEGDYSRSLQLLGSNAWSGPDGKSDEFPTYVAQVADATTGLVEKQSEHFRLFYQDSGPDRILADYALDTLERAYAVLSSELDIQSPDKIRVEIFPDSRRFIQASGLKAEEIETTGTVALCIYNKLMITSPRALAIGYRWMDTLSHELVHLLVAQRSANSVPVWLQEGLAKFFEVRWRNGRGADMHPTSESLLAEALEANRLVPFERMSPSLAKLPSAEEAQLAFAQVQTVIELILQRRSLTGIHQLMQEMREGRTDRQAVEAVLDMSFSEFERTWVQFMKAKRLKRLPGIALLPTLLKAQEVSQDASAPEKIDDPFMAKNKRLRELTRLGDLMRERGRHRAALIEYTKAQQASEVVSPALTVKIAMTWLDNGNPAEARKVLETLLERYNSFAPAYTTLATALLRLNETDGALRALQEANAINPFDPNVHRGLVVLYEAAGQLEKSKKEQQVLQVLEGKG